MTVGAPVLPILKPALGTGGPVILGVDPGSRVTGFAFLEARGHTARTPRDFVVRDAGVIRMPTAATLHERLGLLHRGLHELIAARRPAVCVLERPFCGRNVATAIALGETRGALIAACARHGIRVEELTPAAVKKTVTGTGRAEKETVAVMLQAWLGFERGTLPHDVTDAVAIALTFAMRGAVSDLAAPTESSTPRQESIAP